MTKPVGKDDIFSIIISFLWVKTQLKEIKFSKTKATHNIETQ